MVMQNNPWKWFLEDYPETAYGAFRPQAGTPTFLDYWRGQQGNVWGEYQGALGQMARAGEPPSLEFTSFLDNYPWLQRWFEQSPRQRGEQPGRFAPGLRWSG